MNLLHTHLLPRQDVSTCSESARPTIYHYTPNAFAAYLFLVLFILSSLFHIYQTVRTRTWYWSAFIVGGLLEVIGFIGRAINVGEAPCYTLGAYIMMSLGTLLAPALFAASIYMELGRIMLMTRGEHHSIVRRSWQTKIFVIGDVLSFLMQSAGGGILGSTSSPDSAKLGSNIIVGGLFVQIIFFGLFMINSILWYSRMRSSPPPISFHGPWAKHLWVLFGASGLIMFRSIFRVVEYIQGREGYLMTHEVFLYVFDIALMFFVMLSFHWWHPSEVTALHAGGWVARGWKVFHVEGIERKIGLGGIALNMGDLLGDDVEAQGYQAGGRLNGGRR